MAVWWNIYPECTVLLCINTANLFMFFQPQFEVKKHYEVGLVLIFHFYIYRSNTCKLLTMY